MAWPALADYRLRLIGLASLVVWELVRSPQDDPTSDSWGGQNVFDVFTKAQGTGLGGTEYKEW
jgi:hypothetical protein